MNKKLSLGSIATLASRFKRNSSYEYMNPRRDWIIGLGIAALIFLVGVTYIVFDFYMQFGAKKDMSLLTEKSVVYRDKEVRALADVYDEKERVFNELRKDRTFVIPVISGEVTSETGTSTNEGE